ncbi:MAG: winged helix-turn-helix transcriptional regulator [Lewinellaceae bacterium]|nr:winged helix-turn-helix transcriptional regulator [Lewinellaceae bacterium]
MTIFKGNPFHPDLNAPLYQQIYTHLQTAILSGELTGGTKLPSTRALADELGVSRNTILNAYRQLTAEGYLESSEGSGTFVARVLPDLLLTPQNHDTPQNPSNRLSQYFRIMPEHKWNYPAHLCHCPSSEPCACLALMRQLWMRFPKSWSRLVIKQAKHMSGKKLRIPGCGWRARLI